ncbi:MAG: acyl-ACP--UDP-N-acetylglucosamine O-acyltransferase [Alphaproteobacteria bacterium]|nr:acyl-ACP--UDP-N-acetylglucosamine O-acyltransferase [Alphaproteobacteria bacterium]
MATDIHSTAIIASGAVIGADVKIGPYCVVGADVKLGDGVQLISHVVVDGRTSIGAGTVIYPFASIGQRPQDLKYHGELSTLEIGSGNQIREYVTMNPGTEGGGMVTRVGNNGLFMVGAHVAHDCNIGNNVILVNNVTLGGHVTIGDYAVLGGLSAVHQFVRIGAHAMIGGMSGVESDVIPYGVVKGERAHLAGLNIIGLERRGFTREDIKTLRSAYRMVFAPEGTMSERLEEVKGLYQEHALVGDLIEFIRSRESRALCLPHQEE